MTTRLLSFERWRRHLAGRLALLSRPSYAEAVAAERAPLRRSQPFDPLGRGRPLRILLAYTHNDYGNLRRGTSYETSAFRDSLYQLGCEVIEGRTDAIAKRIGASRVTDALQEMAFRHEVDMLFAVPFRNELDPTGLANIRDKTKTPIVMWFSDDHWRFDGHTVRFLDCISVAVTTSRVALAKYAAAKFDRVIKSQWGVNHRVYRPLNLPPVWDMSFIGQPHSDRREYVQRLRSAGFSVATRGFGWPEGRASLSEAVILANTSKICLNFSNSSHGSQNQVKGRDFELPAMRRAVLTAQSDELSEYYSSDEVVTYSSFDDLREKASELLRNDAYRERLAYAGFQRTLRDHTYEVRLGSLLSEIIDRGWIER